MQRVIQIFPDQPSPLSSDAIEKYVRCCTVAFFSRGKLRYVCPHTDGVYYILQWRNIYERNSH